MRPLSRREILVAGLAGGVGLIMEPVSFLKDVTTNFPSRRPAVSERKFTSEAVEAKIAEVSEKIADPELRWLFANCFPNTLDTTIFYHEKDGKPDTYVITGDIDAMWLRDSTAQVGPYIPLAKHDEKLRKMIAGVVRRQARCIILDPYANAFFDDPNRESEWATDYTVMHPGVHECKWEIDSLCYHLRLAHMYWKATGDTSPFDAEWEHAAGLIVQTFKEQQRKHGPGPYSFLRGGPKPAPDDPAIYGKPVKPIGLICSRFRPSDDETDYQFLIPSNFFAVASLRHMAEILNTVCHKPEAAHEATALANEVEHALREHAYVEHPKYGKTFAYEIDGFGHTSSVVEDPNVPNLLSLPYLEACRVNDPVYQATRRFVWSPDNPWFFHGKYEGLGSPHTGPDMIWPIGTVMLGLTSTSEKEMAECVATLKATHGGKGFMHESFDKNDPTHFSRSWFAWANTLFGEFIIHLADKHPHLLR